MVGVIPRRRLIVLAGVGYRKFCLQPTDFFRPRPIVADNGFPQHIDAAFRRCHASGQGFPRLCFRPVSFRTRPLFRFQTCGGVTLCGSYGLDLPRLFGVHGFFGSYLRAKLACFGCQIIGRLSKGRLNPRIHTTGSAAVYQSDFVAQGLIQTAFGQVAHGNVHVIDGKCRTAADLQARFVKAVITGRPNVISLSSFQGASIAFRNGYKRFRAVVHTVCINRRAGGIVRHPQNDACKIFFRRPFTLEKRLTQAAVNLDARQCFKLGILRHYLRPCAGLPGNGTSAHLENHIAHLPAVGFHVGQRVSVTVGSDAVDCPQAGLAACGVDFHVVGVRAVQLVPRQHGFTAIRP